MPCTVTQSEIEFYEREENKERFGQAALTKEILEEIACTACRALVKAGLMDQQPHVLQRWWQHHHEKDIREGRP